MAVSAWARRAREGLALEFRPDRCMASERDRGAPEGRDEPRRAESRGKSVRVWVFGADTFRLLENGRDRSRVGEATVLVLQTLLTLSLQRDLDRFLEWGRLAVEPRQG